MAELIDIRRVVIGPENMVAHVRLAEDAPLMTSDDLEGTSRVYQLLPHIVEHVCLGDAGKTFRDAMGNTELAHLLEHVTVELLAQTDLAGDMPAGRTWVDEVDDCTYQIELACPDDVLTAAALSCGVWILDWAYRDGGDPEPDVEAIVGGLVQLVEGLEDEGEDLVVDYGPEDDEYDEQDEDVEDDEQAEEDDLDDEPADEDLEPEDTSADVADESVAAAPADTLVTEAQATEDHPLWTDAPVVSAPVASEPHAEVNDDEVDKIMATIEFTALSQDDLDEDEY